MITAIVVSLLLAYSAVGACWSAWWLCREGFRAYLHGERLEWLLGGYAATFWLWPAWLMVWWDDRKLRRSMRARSRGDGERAAGAGVGL